MSNSPEDNLLFAIGLMADSFARLEARVVDCLAHLVNPANLRIGEVISERLSLNQTVDLLVALLVSRGVEVDRQAFSSLSKDIKKAAVIRNDIMHSSWVTPSASDNTNWDIIQERARKRRQYLSGHVLEDLLAEMEKATFFIQEIEIKVLDFHRNRINSKSI